MEGLLAGQNHPSKIPPGKATLIFCKQLFLFFGGLNVK